jgi:hypothetical protein
MMTFCDIAGSFPRTSRFGSAVLRREQCRRHRTRNGVGRALGAGRPRTATGFPLAQATPLDQIQPPKTGRNTSSSWNPSRNQGQRSIFLIKSL